MRGVLFALTLLACLSLLGCQPAADTPPLDKQAAQAKKMPGANTPPAVTSTDEQARKAKED
jgi:hypothetical protein